MKTFFVFFGAALAAVIGMVSLPQRALADTIYEDYTFSTFAGPSEWSTDSAWHDGVGADVRFANPCGMTRDADGNMYLADRANNTIRKVTPSGAVTTLAGLAGVAGSADGEGSAARFNGPNGVAVDAMGNVYVADTGNSTIRKITRAGLVTTLAGLALNTGKTDGTGSVARFNQPFGLVASGTNIFVTDTSNHAIRRVTPDGVVTTFAGSLGKSGSADKTGDAARFNSPAGIAVDSSGNLYVVEAENDTLRVITPAAAVSTLAGLAGTPGSADGTNSTARFNTPLGVAVDAAGNAYVADTSNDTIRKVTPGGVVTTLAGKAGVTGNIDEVGSAARFSSPFGIVVDSDLNLYVADFGNNLVRNIAPDSTVTTIAGITGGNGTVDGDARAARFNLPADAAIDSQGNIFIADEGNQTIRKITPTGIVSTFAGIAGVIGTTNGNGITATFNHPVALAFDQNGNLFVADSVNNAIRKITPAGDVSTFAGQIGGEGGTNNGVGTDAQFMRPLGIAVDSWNNVYVGDTLNHAVRKITPDGLVTTLAGTIGTQGTNDGNGVSAGLAFPEGVVVDPDGNVFVIDDGDHTVRKITPAGDVTTVAGLSGVIGSTDGAASDARFNFPFGIAIDAARNLYVVDTANELIRKITLAGEVTTLGGAPGVAGYVDATGDQARFNSPEGITVDSSGNLYLVDSKNDSIRKGSVALPDRPTVDSSAVRVGNTIHFGVANSTATARNWSFIRYPAASSAQLSSTNAVNPTFTPDVEDLYILRFEAADNAGHSVIRTLTLVADSTPPTLAITNVVSGQTLSNAVFALKGTAGDNIGISNVFVQVNGGPWIAATGTTNWAADISLTSGSNTILAYAQDGAGNTSPTNSITLGYVVSAQLTVIINGGGTVAPNLNGVLLEIGKTYSMTAQPGAGSAFVNWTGDLTTDSPTLTFVMASNSTFTANFTDPVRPSLTITSPLKNTHASNSVFTATGTASDNGQLAAVWYQLNGGGWIQATNTSNWTAGLALSESANTLQAYAVDTFNNVSPTNSVSFTYIPSGRMTVLTTGFGNSNPNYDGWFLQIGKRYTMTAKAGFSFIFSSWSDSNGNVLSTSPSLSFVVQSNTTLRMNFVFNQFAPLVGPFAGLFYDTNNIAVTNSGFFSATLAGFGSFSGKVQLASGKPVPFSGQFLPDGTYSNTIGSKGSSPLIVQLRIGSGSGGAMLGSISGPGWTSPLIAGRADFSKLNPAPQADSYTLVIPGGEDSSVQPGGNGYASVVVDTAGNVTLSGVLGDGTKMTQKTFVSRLNQWPLFVSPYKNQGAVFGWMTFSNQPNSDMNGSINWIRMPQASSKTYPAGFNLIGLDAVGSVYSFAKGIPLLNVPAGGLAILQQGNPVQNFTNHFTLGTDNKPVGTDGLKMKLTTKSGLFNGTAHDPSSGSTVPIGGVLLQKQNAGYGSFLGNGQSGAVYLGP